MGILIDGQEAVDWMQWRGIADACEEAGLDSLFTSDHFCSLYGFEGSTRPTGASEPALS